MVSNMNNKRFIKVYSEGSSFSSITQIWIDTVTGVNYLYHAYGYSGGLTPLLDRDGKPIVTQTNMPEYL